MIPVRGEKKVEAELRSRLSVQTARLSKQARNSALALTSTSRASYMVRVQDLGIASRSKRSPSFGQPRRCVGCVSPTL